MQRTEGFSCRQLNDGAPDEDWTEVLFGWGGDPQEAAEAFCRQFVLNGEAPYHVQSRDESSGEITEWLVSKVLEPVFHAKQKR